jgi:branched-chain amino acid transport system permease protein
VLIVALLLFVQYTKPGRAMRALAQDREATLLMGVNVDRISALGFGIGAMLAGLAGGLLITISAVNAGIGTVTSIKAFIMIMIGGAGVVAGAILGAIVLGFAEAIGYALIPGSTTYLLIFVGLILFLIIRPQGIMGKPWG